MHANLVINGGASMLACRPDDDGCRTGFNCKFVFLYQA
jgi:hypothetical protein